MKTISSKVTHLEMRQESDLKNVPPPHPVFSIIRSVNTPSDRYRFLYNGVGKYWHWHDRNILSDEELNKILRNHLVEIYILSIGYETAGYVEFDRRFDGDIEIAYFGLFPKFIGKGWGMFFLTWAAKKAWSYNPKRVWVHTCDLDHQKALPNYLKAGFKIFKEETIEQSVL